MKASDDQKVRSVSFTGNKVFNDQKLSKILVLQPSARFSTLQLSKDIDAIIRLYQENGFYFVDVKVDTFFYVPDNSEIDLEFKIEENDQVTIDSIKIIGNTIFTDEEILNQFDTTPGEILNSSILENDFHNLINKYERNGYPFASVRIENVRLKKIDSVSKIDVDILIEEGEKVTIDEIKIVGNKFTKSNVILRETRIKKNEVYNLSKIQRISSRLRRLNIFSRVEEPKLYSTNNGNGLWIKVEEGNTSTFDAIIGFAPTKNGEKGIVTGMINVTMRNLFGTARKLNVEWLRDENNSQEIGINYLEPWILNFPFNLGGGFNQRKQDTNYVKRIFNIKAELLLNEELTISGSFNQDNIIPSSTTNLVSRSNTAMFGGDIHYDTRDEIVNTTSGINYRTSYQIGRKNTIKFVTTVQRISIDIDFYKTILIRQILMIGFHGRSLLSNDIELSDLYRFGGTNTLRGYRENQFLASRLAWTNIEYRLIIERRSYIFGFLDNGYYFLPGDDDKGIPSVQKFKYGYGIGVRLETILGNLGVSFAFGEGDSFLEGKIHIGLISEF